MNDVSKQSVVDSGIIECAKQHNARGAAYQNANNLKKAEVEYKKAIEVRPDYEAVYSNLVSVLERQNKLQEAREYVDRCKELFPDGIFIILNEGIVLKREGRLQEAIDLLTTKSHPQDPMTEIKVRHELGLIYDRLGEHDRAFEQFQNFNSYAANAFGINAINKSQYLHKINECKKTFTSEWVGSWPEIEKSEMSLACIMGFARCGTTLLQHILNSHPSIYASEEVHAFAMIEEELKTHQDGYPQSLASLGQGEIDRHREKYFAIHRSDKAYKEADLLVDKYPMLANMSGLVHRLFSDMKFIFIQRHPCDVVLSCYMQLFMPNEAMIHFYDLDDAVNLYVQFMELWDVYEDLLPLNVHYVRYEDVISDFEPTIRKVMTFLDMPWDDCMFNYNEHARKLDIISPSYEQVSEKIYNRAAYRWKNYEEHLEPYMDRLAPYITRFGYEGV